MAELDVQPVRSEPRELGDPVPLLEAKNELLRRVVHAVELVEPEEEPRGLLAEREERLGLRRRET